MSSRSPNSAKLQTGPLEYHMQPVQLAPIVANLVAMTQPQFAARGLAYRATVSPDITVIADPEKLRQIIRHLLSNAIEFTESGGRVTIDVATRDTGDDGGKPGIVFLRVSDTGVGIPRTRQESIFHPRGQMHRDLASSIEDTPTSLVISRDLARGMRGDLRVRSVEGEGSVFTLSLQMAHDERGAD